MEASKSCAVCKHRWLEPYEEPCSRCSHNTVLAIYNHLENRRKQRVDEASETVREKQALLDKTAALKNVVKKDVFPVDCFEGTAAYYERVESAKRFNALLEKYGETIKEAFTQFSKMGACTDTVFSELSKMYGLSDDWWY